MRMLILHCSQVPVAPPVATARRAVATPTGYWQLRNDSRAPIISGLAMS
jgi:hypothetical protein